MLGNLATKLRLLGFDADYYSDINDSELIFKAKNENRIILTKDEMLSNQSKKQKISTIQITSEEEIEQILQINEMFHLGKCEINGKNSRCPKCNGVLQNIEKNGLEGIIPDGVYLKNDEFWKCTKCEKIYWEGTHISNLQKFVAELNDRF